jgi:hypothetical protein
LKSKKIWQRLALRPPRVNFLPLDEAIRPNQWPQTVDYPRDMLGKDLV